MSKISIAAIIAVLIILGFAEWGRAAEPDGAWLKDLKQPDNGATCCNISDCRRTKAEWRGTHWWAEAPDSAGERAMVEVPETKVLKSKQSPDGEAYLCSGYARKVFCFLPPNLGY